MPFHLSNLIAPFDTCFHRTPTTETSSSSPTSTNTNTNTPPTPDSKGKGKAPTPIPPFPPSPQTTQPRRHSTMSTSSGTLGQNHEQEQERLRQTSVTAAGKEVTDFMMGPAAIEAGIDVQRLQGSVSSSGTAGSGSGTDGGNESSYMGGGGSKNGEWGDGDLGLSFARYRLDSGTTRLGRGERGASHGTAGVYGVRGDIDDDGGGPSTVVASRSKE